MKSEQVPLNFDPPRPKVENLDGDTYSPSLDGVRLTGHLGRVYDLMRDMRWRTLADIAALTDGSEAGSSARLRDLRKPKFGEWIVERRRHVSDNGCWEYRVLGKKS